jgi:chromosome segregation protein
MFLVGNVKVIMNQDVMLSSNRLRLKHIKLIGFKSFVDSTTVPFPSNLVGVVGPNGCGKSNIIDAVRWVMGESSAKSLRAEAGIDVIFNGSTERKPVGQASVELSFDNPHGALGGEYAKYSEISIKRVITRDGQSTYYLNNTRCRRKDITDIFLGTGMGPRSYAIIEQGMISKLIEAKPDELRIYIEEAAGISKYKERRKETENRMKGTRENLDRLNDLREELDKQLNRLQRQSEAAAKFKELKEDERKYRSQLLALRWQHLSSQIETLDEALRNFNVALESAISKQRRADSEIEHIREIHHDAQEAYQQVQAEFYTISAQMARLEQSLIHQKERKVQLEQDFQDAETSYLSAKSHVEEDTQQLALLESQLAHLSPQLEIIQAQVEQSTEALEVAEETMHDWQHEWDSFNAQAAKASEQAQVSQTKIQHFDQRINTAKQRIEKIQQDIEKITEAFNPQEISSLSATLAEYAELETDKRSALSDLQQAIQSHRDLIKSNTEKLATLQTTLQQYLGRQASLEALQQAALGKNNDKVVEWLAAQELTNASRLAQTIQVESGWDIAVETVLGNHLQAICTDDALSIIDVIDSLTTGHVNFVFDSPQSLSSHSLSHSHAKLSDKVSGNPVASALLSSVYTAIDLKEALSQLAILAPHESFITPEGLWIGQGWLKVAKDKDESSGVLKREQEIIELNDLIDSTQAEIHALEEILSISHARIQEQEAEHATLTEDFRTFIQLFSNMQADLTVKTARLEQIKHRVAQLEQEREEQIRLISETTESLHEVRAVWQEALQIMETQTQIRQDLTEKRENYREALDAARIKHRENKDRYHETEINYRTLTTELESRKNNISRMSIQLEQGLLRCEHLRESLSHIDEPVENLQIELEDLLSHRLVVEETLGEKRQALENCAENLKMQEQARHQAEQEAENIRHQHQALSMRWQECQVRANTIKEQLDESQEDLSILLNEMPAEANETQWEAQLTNLSNRIARLGPINLAAIDEYQTESERKVYLDRQHDDLVEALNILESAIQKIDKETRAKFKETYEIVNQHFQQLFPKVFGGGSAYLDLTSEDLLETGVSVMARPPGKKNSTIHLLSGGEKALTAIALVFSIFQINPAPFCMLDEVDAPLDDANVGRYCKLIKEMSSQVQFIFISHNKLAIEMAHQLTGVTMKEPGVSRLVAVDIEQAIAMADA